MDMGAILEILAGVDWVQVFTIVITILFFVSQALGNIPQVKENSVFQVAKKLIKILYNSLPKKLSDKKNAIDEK